MPVRHEEEALVLIQQRVPVLQRAQPIAKMEQAPNIDKLLHEFAIGELWYLLGEEGILKGERP